MVNLVPRRVAAKNMPMSVQYIYWKPKRFLGFIHQLDNNIMTKMFHVVIFYPPDPHCDDRRILSLDRKVNEFLLHKLEGQGTRDKAEID